MDNITNPLVSVIIPMYNAQEYIVESLESILNQTYKNIEIIIIDDASTDNSVNLVKQYTDDRITLLCNRHNLRQSKTRNKLLDISKGKYIANMDADDISMPDRIQKQVEYMEKNKDVDICGTNAVIVGKKTARYINNPIEDYKIKEMLNYMDALAHPTVMFRRSSLKKMNLCYDENYRYAQDYKFWCDAKEKGANFHNIPEYLFKYRMSENNVSGKHAYEQRMFADKVIVENIYRVYGKNIVLNTLVNTVGSLKEFEVDLKKIKEYIKRDDNDNNITMWTNILKIISGRYSVYGINALIMFLKYYRNNIFSVWFVKFAFKCFIRYDALNCSDKIKMK